jgi:N,N'-diacetyllegionaminate synthase
MKIGKFDSGKDVLIIAEIGNNHEGSYTLAEEMIGLAAEAGAGAVKFQTFQTEHYVSRKEESRFSRLKSFELTHEELEKLSSIANEAGLLFLSKPFDLESAKFLNSVVPAFKIASGDNNFYPLIETVAHFGKPIIMSSGLSNLGQLIYSKALIERVWDNSGIKQDMAVLHCVSSYPVPPTEANIAAISSLERELQCTVGYSDHTIGTDAAVLSVALGARIIEKHFTIDKNYSDFRDHQISADPEEMAQLVQRIKEAIVLLGSGKKELQASEHSSVGLVRRSIVASRDLPKGAIITWDDITWVRPEGGLSPGQENLVLGRQLSQPVPQGELITLGAIE